MTLSRRRRRNVYQRQNSGADARTESAPSALAAACWAILFFRGTGSVFFSAAAAAAAPFPADPGPHRSLCSAIIASSKVDSASVSSRTARLRGMPLLLRGCAQAHPFRPFRRHLPHHQPRPVRENQREQYSVRWSCERSAKATRNQEPSLPSAIYTRSLERPGRIASALRRGRASSSSESLFFFLFAAGFVAFAALFGLACKTMRAVDTSR